MSTGTIILIVLGCILLVVLLGIFFFLFSIWKSIFVAREVLDTADTAISWGKRAKWGTTWAEKKFGKKELPVEDKSKRKL